jgi:hypothetical protein
MSAPNVRIFNQYYWDFLKKVKDLARDLKYKSDDRGARHILREIKRSYLSFDKLSDAHIQWYREHAAAWEAFLDARLSDNEAGAASVTEAWSKESAVMECELYDGITIGAAAGVFRNQGVALYYLVLLSLFARAPEEEAATKHLVEVLRKPQPWTEEDVDKEDMAAEVRGRLRLLRDIYPKKARPSAADAPAEDNPLFAELENTSLGRLAKEIMNDVDVEEISKSIGEDGDILKALGNPDGGMAKLLGTVSQKMIAKLASGELKQDALMQDAMKLASTLPGMAGGGGKATDGLGNMASMMSEISKMAGMFGGGGEGAEDLMSMMSGMMGGAGPSHGGKGTRTAVNHAAVNRVVRSKQLRRKLEERRRKTEEKL